MEVGRKKDQKTKKGVGWDGKVVETITVAKEGLGGQDPAGKRSKFFGVGGGGGSKKINPKGKADPTSLIRKEESRGVQKVGWNLPEPFGRRGYAN